MNRKKNMIPLMAAAMGLVVLPVQAGDVWRTQTVTLKSGWNAFSLGVAPDQSADEIFASWPVDAVAYYDPAAFLETKQYSGTVSSEGSVRTGYVMWRREESVLSPLKSVPVGIYVCFNTNAASAAAFTTTLAGTPAAPRLTWHPSTTNDAMNLVGISLVDGKTTTIGAYLDGFDGGNVNLLKFYGIQGLDKSAIDVGYLNLSTKLSDGQVVVATCSKATDWSGVLNVSPMYGIDFMTNGTYMTMSVRNDSARARPVKIALGSGSGVMLPSGLMYRDTSHYTNAWISFSAEAPLGKTLDAGATLELMVAVDRTKLGGVAGTVYGGIVMVTDETAGDYASYFRASIPLTVTSDGGASSENAWPKGMWLASAALDTVTFLETKTNDDVVETLASDVKAGGTMKVRLPLYVDKNGDMKLLQRFVYGADTNGTTHVYSPKTENAFPVPIGNVKRVSSAVLPIDAPEIGNVEDVLDHYDYVTNVVAYVWTNVVENVTNVTEGVETNVEEVAVYVTVTNGSFGTTAAFPFTVGETSPVNPYRHVYHPSHDGLKWDFETPTPSGDDVTNYVSTVKPEIFSVKNRITFTWDGSSGTAWNPDEELEGDLKWELDGVRHEGTIRMKGRFSMKRISSATIDK